MNEVAEDLFAVEVTRNIRIPTAIANVSLAATLFLPKGTAPVPALVAIYPYVKDAGGGIQSEGEMRWYAARGYACLLVDFLGMGASDGVQRTPFDTNEADDGVSVIEWAATQSWCTGAVGMWGHSYGAGMTLKTAAQNPPHLKAILAIEGRVDPERHFIHPHGNPGCMAQAMWSGFMLFLQLLPPFEEYGTPVQAERWLRRQNEMEPWVLDFARHKPANGAWRARVFDPANIKVPSFCVAGLRDLFRDATVKAYEAIDAPKKLLFGPWAHSLPHMSPFGAIHFRALSLQWWDYWLRGQDNGALTSTPVTVAFPGGATHWRQFEAWPPPARPIRLKANTTGVLSEKGGQDDIAVPLRASPTTGALSGLYELPTHSFRPPLNQHADDMLGTMFTSAFQSDDLLIGGRPSISVRWRGDSVPDRLIVHLTDVDPGGHSKLIAKGALSDIRSAQALEIGLGAVGYRLLAGHRLRVVLSTSDFPHLWPLASASQGAVIESLTLEIPVVSCDAGVPTDFAGPPLDEAASLRLIESVEPLWTIKRDLVRDSLEVSAGGRMSAITPNREHHIEMLQETTAHIVANAPAAASVNGNYSGTMSMKNGDVIKVVVNVHTTANSVQADGEIEIDGQSVFSRRWSA